MRFDQLRLRDAVIAILIAFGVIEAGAVYRGELAAQLAAAGAPPPAPRPQVVPAAPPAPVHPIRIAVKPGGGAKLVDRPDATAKPIAQLRAGAVLELLETGAGDWYRVRTRSGKVGWVTVASVQTEAASSLLVTLADSADSLIGNKLRAAHAGTLYATPQLADRIGSFAHGEPIEVLRTSGRALLVETSDGADGKVIGYARLSEVRALTVPIKPGAGSATAKPDPDPLAGSVAKPVADPTEPTAPVTSPAEPQPQEPPSYAPGSAAAVPSENTDRP